MTREAHKCAQGSAALSGRQEDTTNMYICIGIPEKGGDESQPA